MVSQGIYTLANDVVSDQLIALLNSIEIHVSSSLPICIIPYDDRLDKVKSEIKNRPNLSLQYDWKVIEGSLEGYR